MLKSSHIWEFFWTEHICLVQKGSNFGSQYIRINHKKFKNFHCRSGFNKSIDFIKPIEPFRHTYSLTYVHGVVDYKSELKIQKLQMAIQ